MIDTDSKLSTRYYDKRDDFEFHIVNIPSGPSDGVYILQPLKICTMLLTLQSFWISPHVPGSSTLDSRL